MSLVATLVMSFLLTVLGHGKHAGNVQAQATVTADVTPTDTPSITPTDTPSVTPTDTPSVTPTVTVTPTVEPSVTPSVTPVATVTPTPAAGDGDKDDMLNLNADVHALFGLMNASFHHEQNEARFEAKHGVDRDGK